MKYGIGLPFLWVMIMFSSCKQSYNDNPAIVIEDALTDVDGNHYDAVRIGDQVWMASNLKTTRYADGTLISDGASESSDSIAYRYAPAANESYVSNYGYLYNWAAVMHGATYTNDNPSGVQGVCPEGWHVPSNAEWREMVDYIEEDEDFMYVSTSVAKALAAPYGWDTTYLINTPGRDMLSNNATGFTALPAGYFVFGNYNDLGKYAFYWTTTRTSDVFCGGRSIGYNTTGASAHEYSLYYGLSVRCVQDEE